MFGLIKALFKSIRDVLWLIVRKKKQEDDPATQIADERKTFQDAVARGDENTVNNELARDLERLRDKDSVQANRHGSESDGNES